MAIDLDPDGRTWEDLAHLASRVSDQLWRLFLFAFFTAIAEAAVIVYLVLST